LGFDKINDLHPSHVGVILMHPTNRYTTHLVAAKYDKNKYLWTAVLDMGDPDHILPYNNTYDL
jgi:hypothetical protein